MEPVNPPRTWWPAPAKLNLMLRITGRRADGYHLLQTVFQLIDYGDRLAFDIRNDGHIINHTPLAGVGEHDDLATRAARLLQQNCGTQLGADIQIDKRIPMGGGLGGGSSDAATTLLVLNHLWGCGLSIEQLAKLGASLGADVPVFVRGHNAWAEGIGDKITPITLPNTRYLVVCPPVHLSTASMFADPLLLRDQPQISYLDFVHGERGNAFTPVARARSQAIDTLFEQLALESTPQLTGSGAAVFCAFSADDPALERTERRLPADIPRFVAQGIHRSPLHELLGAETHAFSSTASEKNLHNPAQSI